MLRRKFLAMLGLAPVAGFAVARAATYPVLVLGKQSLELRHISQPGWSEFNAYAVEQFRIARETAASLSAVTFSAGVKV